MGCLLGLFAQGAPWYWPNGSSPFFPGSILQRHGQYETFRFVNDWHRGLDVAAVAGEDVRSPVDGVVKEIFVPDATDPFPYGHVVIEPQGAPAVKVIHLDPIEVAPPQSVKKGEVLGKVGSWPAPGPTTGDIPTPHVHLELAQDNNEDPLPYLGGRLDRCPPSFRNIQDGSGNTHWPLAFVTDTLPNAKQPIAFYSPPLAAGSYDVLARVEDHFCRHLPFYLPPVTFFIGGNKVSIPGFWIWFPGRRIAPSRLSLRIVDSAGTVVFENTIDVTTTDWNSYREPHDTMALTHVSSGAPNPDFYFVLTHPDNYTGAPVSKWVIPGKDTYEIEVTVEDASGNIQSETLKVDSF
jgi:hypothetical protein